VRHIRLRDVVFPATVWCAAGGLAVLALVWSTESGHSTLLGRFDVRGAVTARFLSSQADDITSREQYLAEQYLTGPSVSEVDFQRATSALGYQLSVLTDSKGRLLNAAPANRIPLGTDLLSYPHIRAALATGKPQISSVVLTAGQRTVPAIGFAVAFDTPSGRRVLSCAVVVQSSTLGHLLSTLVTVPGAVAYLIDDKGQLVAATDESKLSAGTLSKASSGLGEAVQAGQSRASLNGQPAQFTVKPVTGTPWRLVFAMPESRLYSSVNESQRTLRIGLACLALLGLLAVWGAANARARRRELEHAREVAREELAARGEELEVANRDLTKANQAVSDLIGMLSHDMRQPLSLITGWADLAIHELTDEENAERNECLVRIHFAAQRLNAMLEETLTITALDAGGLSARPVPVRVDRAVADALLGLEEALPQVNLAGLASAEALVDPGHLHQVLTNLLTNAAKYGAAPVSIAADQVEAATLITVTDSGRGVPKEFVPSLFERFTRSDAAKSSSSKGTGLGLYIVRELLQANGGDIWYEHSVGKGASFVIRLPRPQASAEGSSKRALSSTVVE